MISFSNVCREGISKVFNTRSLLASEIGCLFTSVGYNYNMRYNLNRTHTKEKKITATYSSKPTPSHLLRSPYISYPFHFFQRSDKQAKQRLYVWVYADKCKPSSLTLDPRENFNYNHSFICLFIFYIVHQFFTTRFRSNKNNKWSLYFVIYMSQTLDSTHI